VIFLSYSREDLGSAAAVAAALRARGEAVASDPPLVEGDPFWRESVARALRSSRRMLVLWSCEAARSPWVEQEVHAFDGPTEFLACPAPDDEPAADALRAERARLIEAEERRLEAFRLAVARAGTRARRRGGDLALHEGTRLRRVDAGEGPAFAMAIGPVTNAQYRDFARAAGYPAPPTWSRAAYRRPDAPVTGVTWFEACAYAAWAGGELPTESEWQRAAAGCDADARVRRPFTDCPPAPAATLPPTPDGFLGMCGNTWHWCSSARGPHRVIRGGSRIDSQRFCGIAAAYRNAPIDRDCTVGFRVKLTLDD